MLTDATYWAATEKGVSAVAKALDNYSLSEMNNALGSKNGEYIERVLDLRTSAQVFASKYKRVSSELTFNLEEIDDKYEFFKTFIEKSSPSPYMQDTLENIVDYFKSCEKPEFIKQ